MDHDPIHKPFYKSLYFQVITAIVIGVLLGHFYPETGTAMKPLGDGFIKLIKMIIAPIIFCTVVVGIAGMEDMKKVGKTGGHALLYFEVVSTIALIVGLVIVNLVQPGAGMNIDPASLDSKSIAAYTGPGKMQTTTEFLLNVIPTTVVDAFAKGEILQVLLFVDAVRLRAAPLRRSRHAGVRLHREELARAVRDRRLHHEGGPDRRLRRDGVHDRQVRPGFADPAGQADGHLLRHLPGLHLRRARRHRPVARLLDLEVHQVHQGRTADRARHLVVGVGAAAHDGQDGEPRRAQVHRRPRHSHRLLVQPRRHRDLPDDGRRLHRPGHQHAADADAGADLAGRAAAHLQGRGRRHRQRLHRAGRHARRRWAACPWPASR